MVRAAVSGNPEARGEVCDRLDQIVRRQARAISRFDADAEDLAQAALLNVVQRLQEVRDCRKLLAWVRVVVLNTHRMSMRRRRSALPAANWVSDLDSLVAPSADPVDHMRAKRELAAVLQAIRRLSPTLRRAFEARVVAGQSTEEAARTLGITPACVRTRLKRAREALLAARLERRW